MSTVLRSVLGGVGGALIGLAMYKFVGCRTGACPLTGNPFIAAFIWGLLGVLIAAGR
jgi:hypothetical protein